MTNPPGPGRGVGRSFLALMAVVGSLLVLGQSPATASSEERVVVRQGLGPASAWTSSPCAGTPQPLEHTFVAGPTGVPHGVGSMSVSDEHGSNLLEFPALPFDGLDAFDVVSMATVPVRLEAYVDLVADGELLATGVSHRDLDAGWQTVDLADAEFDWRYEGSEEPVLASMSQMAEGATGVDMQVMLVWATPCRDMDLHLDALRLGHRGTATLYDFEPPAAHTVVGAATRHLITAGESTHLDVWVSDELGDPVGGVRTAVYGRAPGADGWEAWWDAFTTPSGWLRTTVTPYRTTELQWRSEPLGGAAGGVSQTLLVRVRSAVNGEVRDDTLRRGARVVLSGSVQPLKPGHPVLLMRQAARGARVLARGTVRADGTFRLSRRMNDRGVYRVFAQAPAGDGNLTGRSDRSRVVVR